MFNSQIRRRNRNSISSLEACESRLFLTAPAIYPQPLNVAVAPAIANSETISSQKVDLARDPLASDYAGTWDTGAGFLNLVLKGNPNAPKVKGTATGTDVVGTSKVKGKITGLQLNGTVKGKGTVGGLVGPARINFSVTLTDPTHFSGIGSGTFINIPIPPSPINGTKV